MPESCGRADYDGTKCCKGSKVLLAVDTLGHLFALCLTADDEQDQAQVSDIAKRAQAETGETVEITYGDQGYTGEDVADAEHGIKPEVVKHPTAKRDFGLLPRR